jgi:hypothetical protein
MVIIKYPVIYNTTGCWKQKRWYKDFIDYSPQPFHELSDDMEIHVSAAMEMGCALF